MKIINSISKSNQGVLTEFFKKEAGMNKAMFIRIQYLKKKHFLTFMFLTLLTSSAYSVQPVEIYTYDILPPFAFRDDNGKLTGIYIEMTRKAIERMPDYSVTFNVVPWARAKEATKKGQAFAILPPYFHAHDWLTDDTEKPYIWPYSLQLYHQSDVVICNDEIAKTPRPNFPEDFKGLKFVMFRGDGRAGTRFTEMVKIGDIALQSVTDIKTIIRILQIKRADCTACSELPFAWNIKKLKEKGEYKKIDKGVNLVKVATINTNAGYLGYTDVNDEKNFPFKKDFAIKFDIEIYKIKKSGELDKIIKKFTKL